MEVEYKCAAFTVDNRAVPRMTFWSEDAVIPAEDGLHTPPVEGHEESFHVSHLNCTGKLYRRAPVDGLIGDSYVLDSVMRIFMHIVCAAIKPHIRGAVAIAAETAEKRYPPLRTRAKILCPKIAVAPLVIDGGTPRRPIVAGDRWTASIDKTRTPLRRPPVMPSTSGDILIGECGYSVAADIGLSLFRPSPRHGRVASIFLVC